MCEELRVKHDHAGCDLRPPLLWAPLVPSRIVARDWQHSHPGSRSLYQYFSFQELPGAEFVGRPLVLEKSLLKNRSLARDRANEQSS